LDQLVRVGSDAEARGVGDLGMTLRNPSMRLLELCTTVEADDMFLEPAVLLPASELPWDSR
jgi:hypothetical protein